MPDREWMYRLALAVCGDRGSSPPGFGEVSGPYYTHAEASMFADSVVFVSEEVTLPDKHRVERYWFRLRQLDGSGVMRMIDSYMLACARDAFGIKEEVARDGLRLLLDLWERGKAAAAAIGGDGDREARYSIPPMLDLIDGAPPELLEKFKKQLREMLDDATPITRRLGMDAPAVKLMLPPVILLPRGLPVTLGGINGFWCDWHNCHHNTPGCRMDLKVGDVVTCAQDQPHLGVKKDERMTVADAPAGHRDVECNWFDSAQYLHKAMFPRDLLVRVESGEEWGATAIKWDSRDQLEDDAFKRFTAMGEKFRAEAYLNLKGLGWHDDKSTRVREAKDRKVVDSEVFDAFMWYLLRGDGWNEQRARQCLSAA